MSSKRKKFKLPEERQEFITSFEPKTDNQELLVHMINTREVTVATGSSGVGKTYVTLASALSLLERGFKKIILIKSVTTIPGEDIGFIPGDQNTKMEPFIMSYSWNIDKILGKDASKEFIKKGLIEVMPLAYIRGLSIDDSIVIIDEAQNISTHTFKTIMTRIGTNSKYIFLGDIEQVDRKNKKDSCLEVILEIFKNDPIVGTVEFKDEDCVRNPIIPIILEKLREKGI